MIKKITFIGVMAMLCLNFLGVAQQPVAMKIGETLPENFWTTPMQVYENGKFRTTNLSAYRNQLLVFDFWACWCGGCLRNFPLADSLDQEYSGELKIIGVNCANTGDKPERIVQAISSHGGKMTSVISDSLIASLFPHRVLPHYVWISKGQFWAATGGELLNRSTVEAILKRRKKLELPPPTQKP